MDFDVQITDTNQRTMFSGLVDQDGQAFTALPPGATLDASSSDVAVCNPIPQPGGVSWVLGSGKIGTATITVTPGGTLTGDAFAPRTGQVTIVAGEPAAFQLSVGDESAEPPPPPPSV